MALITCAECSAQISDKAASCPSCGYPLENNSDSFNENRELPAPQLVTVRKSRGIYIILCLFFGGLGIHNFYAGFHKEGAIQLSLSMISIFLWLSLIAETPLSHYNGPLQWPIAIIAFLSPLILFAWVVNDLFATKYDSSGILLA